VALAGDRYNETCWTWDDSQGTLELWTTQRSVFLKAVAANPNYSEVYADIPTHSYCVKWPISEGRPSARLAVLNVSKKMTPEAAEEVARRHMTEAERARRTELQQAARSRLSEHQFPEGERPG